jgi:hypothetical protein
MTCKIDGCVKHVDRLVTSYKDFHSWGDYLIITYFGGDFV